MNWLSDFGGLRFYSRSLGKSQNACRAAQKKTLMKPLVMEFFSLKPFKMSKERAWAHTFLVMVIAGLSRLCGFVTITPIVVG